MTFSAGSSCILLREPIKTVEIIKYLYDNESIKDILHKRARQKICILFFKLVLNTRLLQTPISHGKYAFKH